MEQEKQLQFKNSNHEFDTLIAHGYYFAKFDPVFGVQTAEAEKAGVDANLVIENPDGMTFYFDIRDCFNAVVRREGFSTVDRLDWFRKTLDETARRLDIVERCDDILTGAEREILDDLVDAITGIANKIDAIVVKHSLNE